MAKVKIYTTNVCPYCVRAKSLLDSKGIDYEEHDLTGDDKGREDLVKMSGGLRTVPQIFIGDKHIGGCDNLYALEQKGELDGLLQA
jgi:glutaredoxin 3